MFDLWIQRSWEKVDVSLNSTPITKLNLDSDIMSPGATMSWRDVIKILTDNRTSEIEPEALLEYFEPLMDHLKKENENEHIGWKSEDPMLCPGVTDEGKPLP